MSKASQVIEPTERTTVRRLKERGSHDRELIYGILDEGLVCHVGFVAHGQPYVLPMGYARAGDRLLLHGSSKSRLMRQLAAGAPVCVTVTHLDGVVVARSGFHSSMNYRSVVILGTAREVTEASEKARLFDHLVERLIPGRAADARPSTDKEIKATLLVEVPIREASAKVRTGPPKDTPSDLHLDIWAGVIPLSMTAAPPIDAPDLKAGLTAPGYALDYRRPAGSGDS